VLKKSRGSLGFFLDLQNPGFSSLREETWDDPSHPSILNIISTIIIRQKILNCTQYRDSNNNKGNMGRQKKQGNQFPHSKKLVQEPEGNEENRYSGPDSNKMKVNYAKGPNEAHKNI
jgi:hypothetical protein